MQVLRELPSLINRQLDFCSDKLSLRRDKEPFLGAFLIKKATLSKLWPCCILPRCYSEKADQVDFKVQKYSAKSLSLLHP